MAGCLSSLALAAWALAPSAPRAWSPRVGEVFRIHTTTTTQLDGEASQVRDTRVCTATVLEADAERNAYAVQVERSGDDRDARVLRGGREVLSLSDLLRGEGAHGALPSPRVLDRLLAGETFERHGEVTLPNGLRVPVRQRFWLEERTPRRLRLRSSVDGRTQLGAIELAVSGSGLALVPLDALDRPERVELDYRFAARGGPGEDAASRVAVTIVTEKVSS
jgi:hypothetical protein